MTPCPRGWDRRLHDRACRDRADRRVPRRAERGAAPKLGLGLALSGGGFRAAFFHLGVLARLAERGILSKVEAISTVSGGSIVGGLLYVRLKDLLENKADGDISAADYVRMVEAMEREFLAGVQTNVRAQGYSDVGKNWRMRKADYSRSDRMGELYDERFYKPAWNKPIFGEKPAELINPDGMIQMRDLDIRPHGGTGGVRDNAVPVLIVNSTSLNTGHNWRFLASGMGEDPRSSEEWVAIDKNMRYETSNWDDIAPHQQTFELGLAVAASACVPGLFHPLAVSDLFKYRLHGSDHDVRVQLVDGGVHDNQGVCGLIDARCTKMIVSDASGQLGDRDAPPTRIHAAAIRSTSGVYGDRVREEQLAGVLNWRRPAALVHLKKGLPSRLIRPLGKMGDRALPVSEKGKKSFGVHEGVQELLSGTRTDLDAFSDVEAHSLACFGYQQALEEVEVEGIAELADADERGNWSFLKARPFLAQAGPPDSALDAYRKQLGVAQGLFGKAMKLGGPKAKAKMALAALFLLLFVGLPIAVVVFLLAWFLDEQLTTNVPVWATFVAVGAAALLTGLLVWLYLGNFKSGGLLNKVAEFLYARLSPAVLTLPLWAVSQMTLWLSHDFLEAGRFERLR